MSSKNMFSEKRNFRFGYHCVKSVFIWSFSGRYFPAFITDESSALNLHLIGTTSSRFGIIFL